MIHIRDAEILDILPYTFKKPEYMAMSSAMSSLHKIIYDKMSSVLFWADIENAAPVLLDLMAAELDAPFYSSDMTVEQKRASIVAAYKYNRTIGTVSSVEGLLSAAFGTGKVSEWFEYGGEDFYFKLKIESEPPLLITKSGYELLKKRLEQVKPKRAKLEAVVFTRSVKNNLYIGMKYVKTYKKFTVPAVIPDTEGSGY